MQRALSGLLLLAWMSFAEGCSEYNLHITRSEDQALSGIVQLTHGFARAGLASLSNDSRWIVFQAVPSSGGDYQIYLAKVIFKDGEISGFDQPIRVTPPGSRSVSGSISPDGFSLIFSSGGPPEGPWIYRADGWEGAVSVADPAVGINLAQHILTTALSASDCSFSPNGKFICCTARDGDGSSIYVMHADGTHIVRITSVAGQNGGPCFSPDGLRLAYRGDRHGKNQPQVFVADLSFDPTGEIKGVSAERQLTHDDCKNYGPRWHPDGQHIVYCTNRDGTDNYDLYLMDRDGRHKTRITFFQGADLLPSFSADGKYILWTSRRSPDATMQIFLAKFTFPRGS